VSALDEVLGRTRSVPRKVGPRVGALPVLVAGCLVVLFGCRTIDRTLQKEHVPCGVYRWQVKILTDPDAKSIRFEPIDATIHDLVRLPRPLEPRERRRTEAEFRVYRVRAVLEAVRPRIDQDFHLLLRDPTDPEARMIAEIPSPRCALESPYVAAFASARRVAESFRSRHGGILVEVSGPGFFDVPDFRIGGAPNGFELHPVLELTEIRGVNSSAMPGHSPDEALIANRTSLSPTSRPAIAPIQGFRISRRNAALQANLLAKRRRHAAE